MALLLLQNKSGYFWRVFVSNCVCLSSVICGGTLNATSVVQTVTSPFFPDEYPPYTSCRWILDAPALETIKMSIQTFVLQPDQSCSANYLELKDWPMVSTDRPRPTRAVSLILRWWLDLLSNYHSYHFVELQDEVTPIVFPFLKFEIIKCHLH